MTTELVNHICTLHTCNNITLKMMTIAAKHIAEYTVIKMKWNETKYNNAVHYILKISSFKNLWVWRLPTFLIPLYFETYVKYFSADTGLHKNFRPPSLASMQIYSIVTDPDFQKAVTVCRYKRSNIIQLIIYCIRHESSSRPLWEFQTTLLNKILSSLSQYKLRSGILLQHLITEWIKFYLKAVTTSLYFKVFWR